MGTKVRVDQIPADDYDDWDEDYNEEQSSRNKKTRDRWRDIEDKLEERRLQKQIDDNYYEERSMTF